MKRHFVRWLSLLTVVMMFAAFSPNAEAVLKDKGPLNFAGYPTWYRDNNNLALQQCVSKAISPVSGLAICNLLAFPTSIPPFNPALPLTFYPNPPTGYNWPLETFYYSINPDKVSFVVAPNKGKITLLAALEGSFSNNANPTPGDQIVFARIRAFLVGTPSGDYTVTHPYGVEKLTVPNDGGGVGTLRFTRDIGLIGTPFEGAVNGDIGPFLVWTVDNTLAPGVQNPDGTLNVAGEIHLGDFNVAHTFTGSKLGTNFFRVDGPVGSGIGGPGIDFIQTNLANLEGQKYTTPIPTPLAIDRATYRRDATFKQLDVFASTGTQSNQNTPSSLQISDPLLSGINPPVPIVGGTPAFAPLVMDTDGTGKFFSHIELPLATALPQFIQVSNIADSPATTATLPLVDEVIVTAAAYDPVAHTLHITANSSDAATPPSLTALGYGALTAGVLTYSFPAATLPNKIIPPATVTVVSSAGGSDTANVTVLQNSASNVAPVAVNDTATAVVNVATILNVTANDTDANGNLAPASVVITSSPTGPGVANATVNVDGTVNFTANTAGSYTFSYTVSDTLGVASNAATVTVTVNQVNHAPVANADTVTTPEDTPIDIDVLLNDTDQENNIDPLSTSVVSQPANGTTATKVVGGKRVITYTPKLNFNGLDSFTYQITDLPGLTAIGTVTVTVTPVNDPPVAVADTASATSGVPTPISVLANDSDVDGTLNPASVAITTPATNGTAVANANGTVTYTSAPGFTGTATFSYRVADNNGAFSAPAQVTVSVVPSNETITVTRARYAIANKTWSIDGTTTVFGPGVNNVMTVYRGSTIAGILPALGTATVTNNGTWTLNVTTLTDTNSPTISVQSSGGATRLAAPVQAR